ncbi:MAG: hypothetical protein ACK4TO_08695 [Candidatus Nitrosotenuis sp.]
MLKEAIQKYGKPAAILSVGVPSFMRPRQEKRQKAQTLFETFLIEQGISQRLSRVRHPQTNGKIERFLELYRTKWNGTTTKGPTCR